MHNTLIKISRFNILKSLMQEDELTRDIALNNFNALFSKKSTFKIVILTFFISVYSCKPYSPLKQ